MDLPHTNTKHSQKESLLFKKIAQLFQQAALDESVFVHFQVSRVALSPDKGMCRVYLYSHEGEEYFNSTLDTLKLYKPSLRKALAQEIPGRYTPQITFMYDKGREKSDRINSIIDSLKDQGRF